MAANLNDGVARIRNATRGIAGSGFLVGSNAVMTCAHVVNDALGLPALAKERPNGTLIVDLPFINLQGMVATIHEWRPPRDGQELEVDPLSDIAVLKLPSEVETQPYAVANGVALGTQLRALGFPRGSDQGEDAALTVGLPTTFKWLAVDSDRDVGVFVRRGYSGGPAVDPSTRTVAGMVVATGPDALRRAFLIPGALLKQAFPKAVSVGIAGAFDWPPAPANLIELLTALSPAPLPPALVPVDLIRLTAQALSSSAESGLIILQVNQLLVAAGPISGIQLQLPPSSLPEIGPVEPLRFWLSAFTTAAQRGGPVLVALLASIPTGVSIRFRDAIRTICNEAKGTDSRH